MSFGRWGFDKTREMAANEIKKRTQMDILGFNCYSFVMDDLFVYFVAVELN